MILTGLIDKDFVSYISICSICELLLETFFMELQKEVLGVTFPSHGISEYDNESTMKIKDWNDIYIKENFDPFK